MKLKQRFKAYRMMRYVRRYVVAETAILSMLAQNNVRRSERRRFMRELVTGTMTITKVLAFIEQHEGSGNE